MLPIAAHGRRWWFTSPMAKACFAPPASVHFHHGAAANQGIVLLNCSTCHKGTFMAACGCVGGNGNSSMPCASCGGALVATCCTDCTHFPQAGHTSTLPASFACSVAASTRGHLSTCNATNTPTPACTYKCLALTTPARITTWIVCEIGKRCWWREEREM